ncbi:Hadh protein [Obelidium mucronatum]|nr:Hadh protein [Obelidium mucronatum]
MSISRVSIVGGGLMGAGIAQSIAAAPSLIAKGVKVTLVDVSQDRLDNGKKIISQSLNRVAKKKFDGDAGKMSEYGIEFRSIQLLEEFHSRPDAGAAAADSDLVVEAIVENLDAKQKLFRELDARAPKSTIFASNTSSLPISEIAKATLSRRDRFAGLHFFNPVPQMKLVEIVRTSELSDSAFASLKQLVQGMDKVGVECKDTPGFIVNRLLVPYMLEAVRLVERGDASKEDVDIAMKLGAGYPMGPFELADYVGLDTTQFISEGWYKSGKGLQGKELVEPPTSLTKLVSEGKFGRKNGEGFYNYKK